MSAAVQGQAGGLAHPREHLIECNRKSAARRGAKARIKAQIKYHEIRLVDILRQAEIPVCLCGTTMADALAWQPAWGPTKIGQFLKSEPQGMENLALEQAPLTTRQRIADRIESGLWRRGEWFR